MSFDFMARKGYRAGQRKNKVTLKGSWVVTVCEIYWGWSRFGNSEKN